MPYPRYVETGDMRKQPQSSTNEQLVIGCNVSSEIDARGVRVYDRYLPITNFGPTDSFIVQIVAVNPPSSPVASLPWYLRWDSSSDEAMKIIHDHSKSLYFCRTDLTSEIHDGQTGHWKPGRVWFFMPSGQKEIFISTTGVQRSSELYNLRLEITLYITALSTEEKIMRKLTLGFNVDTSPQIVALQSI